MERLHLSIPPHRLTNDPAACHDVREKLEWIMRNTTQRIIYEFALDIYADVFARPQIQRPEGV